MELAIVVYLIGVLPSLAGGLGFIGVMGTLLLLIGAIVLTISGNEKGYYYWDNKEEKQEQRKAFTLWGKRCFKASAFTIFLGFVSALIPSEKTMYTMVAAYAGQKIAETPQAAQIANDGVDVLKELLAKAKRELAEDKKEEKPEEPSK